MIRDAEESDIPALVHMAEKLHRAAGISLPLDREVAEQFLRALLRSPLGMISVVDEGQGPTGFLSASVGRASISRVSVAIEHSWWAESGGGLALLKAYEKWARQQGCYAARMSSPPGAERVASILERSGYKQAELAWAKVF